MPELLVEPKERVEVNTDVNLKEPEEKSLSRTQPEPGAKNNESTENPTLHPEPGEVKDENVSADKPEPGEVKDENVSADKPEPGEVKDENVPSDKPEPGEVKDEDVPADKPVTDAKSSQPVFGESLPGLESPKHSNPESREEPPSKLETEKDVINLKDDPTNTKFKDSVDELTDNYLEPKPFEVVSLAQQFIQLGLPLDAEILDVACGTGVVAEECRMAGYTQIDGLDPCQGYLEGGISRGIFRKVFREFIDPEKQTSIPDSTYDALLCCAGFFQGLISPLGFQELIRITKPGGIISWNIAEGYEHYDHHYARFDEYVMMLVRERRWEFARPVVRHEKMAFTDCGSAYLRGFETLGGIQCEGFTYTMRKV